jgi:hypothetical protein
MKLVVPLALFAVDFALTGCSNDVDVAVAAPDGGVAELAALPVTPDSDQADFDVPEAISSEDPAVAATPSFHYTMYNVTLAYSNRPHTYPPCTVNSHWLTYRPGYPTPNAIANGCPWRVWLYQWNNGTGYRLCVSKFTNSIPLYRSYKSLTVSYFNGDPCP